VTTEGDSTRYLPASSGEPPARYIAVTATNSEIMRYLPVTVTTNSSSPRYLVTSGKFLITNSIN
jgi:hypothetical protein